jgi:hypothetical protein
MVVVSGAGDSVMGIRRSLPRRIAISRPLSRHHRAHEAPCLNPRYSGIRHTVNKS